MAEGAGAVEVFLRLLGVYGACLAAGFALKRLARPPRPAAAVDGAAGAAPKGPGIGRKFKVFFAFQGLLLTLSFWWLPGMTLFLLGLLAASVYEIAQLHKTASLARRAFPSGAAYGLLVLFTFSIACYILAASSLLDSPRPPTGGMPFLAFLFLLVAVFDGFSQICGEILRGPKLVPRISPGKTWSGFAGGLAFCTAAALAGQSLIYPYLAPGAALVAGAAVGALAFAGDISASWVKRRIGVKDFSRLLGPQGGVLDRADSLLWLGPAYLAACVLLPRHLSQSNAF